MGIYSLKIQIFCVFPVFGKISKFPMFSLAGNFLGHFPYVYGGDTADSLMPSPVQLQLTVLCSFHVKIKKTVMFNGFVQERRHHARYRKYNGQ